jgi:CDP-diacylglycerol---glycerol-3-phosphate 3-phosphatidyltransferase
VNAMLRDPAVSPEWRARIKAGAQPVAEALGRLGLSPNALTVLGFAISSLAGAMALAQLWLLAAIVSVSGAAFDLFDGVLARATGRASVFGAFLDSTLDRWGEGIVYAGVAGGCAAAGAPLAAFLASLAMASAFMVSYSRAKAESLGLHGEVGIAPRPERVVVLGVGLAAAGLTGGPAFGPWLQLALGLLFLVSTITTIQRIWHVRRQIAGAAK